MTTPTTMKKMKVIISGGGIGGLTLANALQHANIDYVLLERRQEVAPQVGATIGIMPNGARIVDQLGCYDAIANHSEPMRSLGDHYENGNLIIPRGDFMQLIAKRTGYDPTFLDRQLVLQILYDRISDKKKVLVGKKIIEIEHSSDGVRVRCEDGSLYEGDMIAGADGVQSSTRQAMWKAATAEEPNAIPKKDKEGMIAEYKCLYGISSPTKNQRPGDVDVVYGKGRSSLHIIGKAGRAFWFMFERLPERCSWDKIPRYSTEDAIEFGESFKEWVIQPESAPSGLVKFGDLWANRISFALVPLEEAKYEMWSWGRFACLGDSIAKMTPNAGSGGNAAIESAAALANALQALNQQTNGRSPTYDEMKHCLKVYQQSRQARAGSVVDAANALTRIHALHGLMDKFMAFFVLPQLGDMLVDMQSDVYVGATMLNYIPVPPRSISGTMPFNPSQGVGKKEWFSLRLLLAFPFFGLAYLAWIKILCGAPLPTYAETVNDGYLTYSHGTVGMPRAFTGIKWFDDIWQPVVAIFAQWLLGYDEPGSWQLFSFLTDYGVYYTILLIESCRRSNILKFAQIPASFALVAQLFSIGVIGPIYWALFYASNPVETFRATDSRLTDLRYTRAIVPSMLLAYYTPHFLSAGALLPLSPTTQLTWGWAWQLFPLGVSALMYVLGNAVFARTVREDRLVAPKRDLPIIRATLAVPISIAAAVWWYTLLAAPVSWRAMFIPLWDPTSLRGMLALRNVIQFDYLLCFGVAGLYLLYAVWDFKAAGMVQTSWAWLLGCALVATVALGPGAALGLAWLWREDIITERRHRDAVLASNEKEPANGNLAGAASEKMNGYANGYANGHVN